MVIRRIKRFLGLKPGNQRRKQVIRVLTMTEEGEINVLSIKEEGEINVLSTKEEGGAKVFFGKLGRRGPSRSCNIGALIHGLDIHRK